MACVLQPMSVLVLLFSSLLFFFFFLSFGGHLQGANLQGVNMVRAECEQASMRGCNFDDPSGKSANMEGERSFLFSVNYTIYLSSQGHYFFVIRYE